MLQYHFNYHSTWCSKLMSQNYPSGGGISPYPSTLFGKPWTVKYFRFVLAQKQILFFIVTLHISKEEFCYRSFIGNTWIKLTYFLFEAVKIIQFMQCISQTLPGLSGSYNCNYLNIDKSNLMQCWQFYQVSQISHKNYSKNML